MKIFRLMGCLTLAAAACMALTACSDDEDELITDDTPTVTDEDPAINVTYNADGVWSDCLNPEVGDFEVDGLTYTHSATDWGGFVSWTGFCPSKVDDTTDYTTEGTWTSHDCASITGGSRLGVGKPYIVGFWSSYSMTYSCAITKADGSEFDPACIYVTNNTYSYYAMLNGTDYNSAFKAGDWQKLYITGINGDAIIGTVTVDLADGTDILDTWQKVDLSGLGYVTGLVFSMASSDTGEWGMNTPAYFCISPLQLAK